MSNIVERKRKKPYKTSEDSDAEPSKVQVYKFFEITQDEDPEGDPMLYPSCPVHPEGLRCSDDPAHHIQPTAERDDSSIFHDAAYLLN